ncbi:hypothetical protein PROFUN_08284 [Planoprotostelium fungivorum]|uniref:Adenosine deaminase domain-containing protein n=1 Tax=Planoprotostelium fungivorum TaxID=1890364 RepID=A0A2P6NJZ5_9EUKA|nr:hypothetical protein PROFUN_08284 [Planoprotostelium fungivorum]
MEHAESLEGFCKKLPKIELHAHLNGSIRMSTIQELWDRKADRSGDLPFLEAQKTKDFQSAFSMFSVIYQLVQGLDVIDRITREVIEDFAKENVIYVELRTTLKAYDDKTKLDYLDVVLKAMRETAALHNIEVNLLVSINRAESLENAMEAVELAVQRKDQGVVGIDLCGNPVCGKFSELRPALEKARREGFKLTLHAAEIVNYGETQEILDFSPERLGHAVFMTDDLKSQLFSKKIPVEICITSNIKSQSCDGPLGHHFGEFYRKSHPIILCTDDMGVFCTSVSQEFSIVGDTFQLGREELYDLSLSSIDCSFASEASKETFRRRMRESRTSLGLENK